ncbi:MAG: hypothetical protein ACOY7L_18450 [Pseudomonadota bacterium]
MTYTFEARKKDPAATLDYAVDWSDWLAADETIEDYRVICEDDDIEISTPVETAGVVRFQVGGGLAGADYYLTIEVSSSSGQIDQRTLLIPVRER